MISQIWNTGQKAVCLVKIIGVANDSTSVYGMFSLQVLWSPLNQDSWEKPLADPGIKNSYSTGCKVHLLLALASRTLLAVNLIEHFTPSEL